MSRDVSQTRLKKQIDVSVVKRQIQAGGAAEAGVATYTVSRMLINKSHPHPATKKAPAGGKKIVTRIRMISEALTDMSGVYGMVRVSCGVVSRVGDALRVVRSGCCGGCGNHRSS